MTEASCGGVCVCVRFRLLSLQQRPRTIYKIQKKKKKTKQSEIAPSLVCEAFPRILPQLIKFFLDGSLYLTQLSSIVHSGSRVMTRTHIHIHIQLVDQLWVQHLTRYKAIKLSQSGHIDLESPYLLVSSIG